MTAKLSCGLKCGSGPFASLCFFCWRKKTLKRVLQKPEGTVRLSAPIINNSDNPTFDIKARFVWRKDYCGGSEVPIGTCPECDADVHVDTDTDKGELVSCEECGTDLEVVGLDPVELDIVEEEAADDDEDEDEF